MIENFVFFARKIIETIGDSDQNYSFLGWKNDHNTGFQKGHLFPPKSDDNRRKYWL
jgi:hypothetical protein